MLRGGCAERPVRRPSLSHTLPADVRVLRDLIERRVFRYVVAYAAAAWGVLEVIDQLVGNDVLPQVAYRIVLTLALCALPGALIVSWFHGAEGRQQIPPVERGVLAVGAVIALTTLCCVAKLPASADAACTLGAPATTENPARVAVLYMEPRGGEEAEFLASGLTEALI